MQKAYYNLALCCQLARQFPCTCIRRTVENPSGRADALCGEIGRHACGVFQAANSYTARGNGTACGVPTVTAIRNPHLIYPGQVLVLRYVNGQPRLDFEGVSAGDQDNIPTIKLSPRVREISVGSRYPNREC
jgi:hypothetical protein